MGLETDNTTESDSTVKHTALPAKDKRLLWGSALAALIILSDQLSKWAVSQLLMRPENTEAISFFSWLVSAGERFGFQSIEITPFFNLVMVWNYGVSFGMFNNGTTESAMILVGVSSAISLFFLIWFFKTRYFVQALCMAAVIGGAIGNIWDRLRFGAVVDFLDFHVMGYHWPAFNIADCAVVIGVFLLVIHSWLFEKPVQQD